MFGLPGHPKVFLLPSTFWSRTVQVELGWWWLLQPFLRSRSCRWTLEVLHSSCWCCFFVILVPEDFFMVLTTNGGALRAARHQTVEPSRPSELPGDTGGPRRNLLEGSSGKSVSLMVKPSSPRHHATASHVTPGGRTTKPEHDVTSCSSTAPPC